ncbi:hypothetical protein ACFL96_03070 [Thermoproteota archaeon]
MYKMAEQSKKITLYIFLFVLFIALAFFVGTYIYNIYISTTTSSTETTKTSLECAFTFTIKNMGYDFPELSFDVRTSDLELFKKLVIEVEGIGAEVELGEFFDFEQKVVVEDIVIEDSFNVYPEGCKEFNQKQCSLKQKECIIIN